MEDEDAYFLFKSHQNASPTQIARHAHIAKAVSDYLEQQQIDPRELMRRLGLHHKNTRVYGWLGMTAAPRLDIRMKLARLLGVPEDTLKAKNVPWTPEERARERARRGVLYREFTLKERDSLAKAEKDNHHDKGAPAVTTIQTKPTFTSTALTPVPWDGKTHNDVVTMSVDSTGMATLRVDIRMPLDRTMPLFQLLLEEVGRAGNKGVVTGVALAVDPFA